MHIMIPAKDPISHSYATQLEAYIVSVIVWLLRFTYNFLYVKDSNV